MVSTCQILALTGIYRSEFGSCCQGILDVDTFDEMIEDLDNKTIDLFILVDCTCGKCGEEREYVAAFEC